MADGVEVQGAGLHVIDPTQMPDELHLYDVDAPTYLKRTWTNICECP